MNAAVTIPETMALAAMEPTPIIETARREMRGPNTASSKKLQNGIAGMTPVSCSNLTPHLAGAVGIEHAMLVIKPQKQGQADGNFRSGHGQNKEEHDLAIRLHPVRARDDKG